MRETNFTLGPIQKSLYLLLLYQFTFAQNRPKSENSGALGPIHYITLKAVAMALGDGTKCKTCFEKYFSKKRAQFFRFFSPAPLGIAIWCMILESLV